MKYRYTRFRVLRIAVLRDINEYRGGESMLKNLHCRQSELGAAANCTPSGRPGLPPIC
jgi:hypothetical protein